MGKHIYLVLTIFLTVVSLVSAQKDAREDTTSIKKLSTYNKQQRFFNLDFNINRNFITNNSALGRAGNEKIGFNLGLQVYLYKNFFVGGFTGTSYVDIEQPELVGNFSRSRITHSYIQFGYEQPIGNHLRLGVNISPFGQSHYKNRVIGSSEVSQTDRADVFIIGARLSYFVDKSISTYIVYSYRQDNTKIVVPEAIQDQFNKIQYHNIGIGVCIYVGSQSLFTHLITN